MKLNSIKELLLRFNRSTKQYGISGTIIKLKSFIQDIIFDFQFNVNTQNTIKDLDRLSKDNIYKENCYPYKPTQIIHVRMIFNLIKPMIPSDSVMVDFGCGKGRVLLIASEFGYRIVRGVEFSKELCQIARKNCRIYRAKTGVKTEFEIIESDASNYVLNYNDNVIFMFNPFDEEILDKVLDNIIISVRKYPRKVLIVYENPKHSYVFDKSGDFEKVREIRDFGHCFILYTLRR